MSDFDIVNQYMAETYPNVPYTIRQGNGAIWVSKGMIDMYFIIKHGKILDIQID
jgi:hypothetical protein